MIELTGGDEASETARFVGMVDKFFDALNVHNYTHGVHSRKRFKMTYTSGEDMRLKLYTYRSAHIGMNSWIYLILCHQWLERDFLGYLAC